jgi:hypothetical protein
LLPVAVHGGLEDYIFRMFENSTVVVLRAVMHSEARDVEV